MPEIFLLFFLVSVVGFFALYWVISHETSNPRVVDRETAEREARELGGSRGSQGHRRGRSGGNEPRGEADGRDREDRL